MVTTKQLVISGASILTALVIVFVAVVTYMQFRNSKVEDDDKDNVDEAETYDQDEFSIAPGGSAPPV